MDGGSPALRGEATRQDRTKKRRRGGGAAINGVAAAPGSPGPAATAAAPPEPMDEDTVMMPAADEPSAGEGLADPGDGDKPAEGRRFGGGAVSESENGGGGGGGASGRGLRQLIGGGAIFSEEEGDYAADSERSTDHESMHLCGGGGEGPGGGRESDEHDMSEREAFRQSRGRAGDRRGRRRHGVAGIGTAARRGGGEGRGGSRASSPETTSLDADGENSSGRSSRVPPGVGWSRARTSRSASPKRRRVGTGIGESGRPRGGDALLAEIEEQSGSLAHSEASGSAGTGGSAHEDEEEEEEAELHEASPMKSAEARGGDGVAGGGSGAGAGVGAVTPLEWKAKLGRQPIFMSRGLPEEDAGLLPSHSEGGTPETRSPGGRSSGVRVLSRPVQDPEDDRDRASSCSSADAPIHGGGGGSRPAGGGIVRLGSRRSVDTRGGGDVEGSGGGGDGGRGASSPPAEDSSSRSPPPATTTTTTTTTSKLPAHSPNSPGGVVPWHHTSVYEANNPTEDRHAELSHDALGVKIYCVCDGHGGSRAAQFVCDHLAADVLARVESIAAATAGAATVAREPDGGGGRGNGANNGEGEGGSGDNNGSGWMRNEAEIRRSLEDAFTSCDEQFIAQLDPTKNRGYINAGCCVVLALLVRSKLYVAHVGDCRVVLGTTDAARFSPDLLATAAGAPSTPTGPGAAPTAVGKRDGGVAQNAGVSVGKGRSSKGVGEAATEGARRVASPPRAAADGDLKAVALTRDHNCEDADEVALVRARSGDDNAIRVSRNDQWKGLRAIKRVAGSLAVTRAVGDAYLKKAVFSFSHYKVCVGVLCLCVLGLRLFVFVVVVVSARAFAPLLFRSDHTHSAGNSNERVPLRFTLVPAPVFSSHRLDRCPQHPCPPSAPTPVSVFVSVGTLQEGVPYITAEPVVTTVELTSKDRFLVLATDGVWEQASNEEAVHCVSRALRSASVGGYTNRRQRSTPNRNASGGGGATGGAGAVTSDALVDFVLARSAQSHGMSVPALRALPRGSSRRMLHDDVCATVVHFTPAPRSQQANL